MSTAVGSYALLAKVKERLTQNNITWGTQDDSLLQSMCDQVNSWIESPAGAGRVVGPFPAFASTVVSGFAAGTNTGVLTSTSGLSPDDALMLGAVTGTHEHGTVVDISGTTVTLQGNLVSSYAADQPAKRVYLYDGCDAIHGGRTLLIHEGISSVLSLEVATTVNGPYTLIAGTDFFLRPVPSKRVAPGRAATEVTTTDTPIGASYVAPLFTFGRGNVRIDATIGLTTSIPDALSGLAQKLVVEAFKTVASAGGNTVTVGLDGQRTFEQAMSVQDWALLKSFQDMTPGF